MANRLPIGLDSIVKNANYATVRRFYKDWYRPDLMAVIVVGDIDPGKAEQLIKEHFNKLKNPVNERPRIHPPVPPYKTDEAKVVTDKEATSYSIVVNYSAEPLAPIVTLGDYKNDLAKDIFTTLFNQRLRELTQKENPPFVYAYTEFGSFARGFESFSATVGIGNNDATNALAAFEEELERVKKYGFTKPELERAKSDLATQIERTYNERKKTESANYVSEYLENFLSKEPIPGIANEYNYYKELLPQISIENVNEITKRLQQDSKQFIALLGPEPAAGKSLPSGDDLLATVASVDKMDIKPYEEKAVASSLLSTMPSPEKL